MPLMAFQAGMAASVFTMSRGLERRGHPRLAKLAVLADILGETWAVQHNLRLPPRPAQPGGLLRVGGHR